MKVLQLAQDLQRVVTVTVLLSNTQEVKLTVDIALRLKAVVVDKADGV